jgi:hypothetical protein
MGVDRSVRNERKTDWRRHGIRKHANFIVNTGKATAADVYELIACIKDKVYREEGIVLKEEIRYVGEIREKEIP